MLKHAPSRVRAQFAQKAEAIFKQKVVEVSTKFSKQKWRNRKMKDAIWELNQYMWRFKYSTWSGKRQ